MALSVLICDDSKFARNQMAKSFPTQWDIELSFASDGAEALEKIQQGLGDLLFLDLNMPVMDGYETLERIREMDLQTMVIVVSGDVQEKAKQTVKMLGAMDFIEKPFHLPTLLDLLEKYGVYSASQARVPVDLVTVSAADSVDLTNADERLDVYREMVNVAMGVAGKNLSSILDEFISLPIPSVNYIAASEITMAINSIHQNASVSGISQGFISKGINGEAILIFDDADFSNIIKLLDYPSEADKQTQELEALMDIGNILIGACVHALGEQIHLQFSLTHPVVLGQHMYLERLLQSNVSRMNQVLAMEIGYSIQSLDIKFELLLLFPEKSVDAVTERFLVGKVS